MENDPVGAKLLVADSDLINEKVSRFAKFYKSPDDLLAKIRMLKFMAQNVGGCYMRCTGMDALMQLVSKSSIAIRNYGTKYWEKFLNFVKMIQQNDFALFSGSPM